MVSNVILFGYQSLSDSEKLTYMAIDSFDWSDGEGKRKGFAFPSLSTLAEKRGVDERTMRRHIVALETAGLLRREQRSGQPSLLWIEEPSKEESDRYLSTIATGPDTDVRGTPDKNVRPLYEESDESQKKTKPLTASKALKGRGGGRRFLSAQERAKCEYIAGEILKFCGDEQSLGFYRKVAAILPSQHIFETLSELRARIHDGRATDNRGRLFTAIVRRKVAQRQRAAAASIQSA